jgi:hypothetical protein
MIQIIRRRLNWEFDYYTNSILTNCFNRSKAVQRICRATGEVFCKKKGITAEFDCMYKINEEETYDAYFKACGRDEFDFSTVYPASNDEVGEIAEDVDVLVGVGNMDMLNVMCQKKFKHIVAYDINESQLVYFEILLRFIRYSETKEQFIESLLEFLKPRASKIEGDLLYFTNKVIGTVDIVVSVEETENKALFPIVRNNGFLGSDDEYATVRENVLNTPLYIVKEGFNKEFVQKICEVFKYEVLGFWVSNILSPFFYYRDVQKGFRELEKQIFFKQHPDVFLLSDKRRKHFQEKYVYPYTKHKWVFTNVLRMTEGEGIEIVLKREREHSMLPNYTLYEIGEELPRGDGKTIFLHSLGERADEVMQYYGNSKNKLLVYNGQDIVVMQND